MAAARKFPYRLVLLLALVPLAWWLLDYSGKLGRLKNVAMDWLFLYRGQIPAVDKTKPGNPPLKLWYVDVDAPTVEFLGERPWPRDYYARVINAICKYGGAKAVGLDFIFSPAGTKSQMVDQAKARENNEMMANVMQAYPQVVIAASYSNVWHSDTATNADKTKTGAKASADANAAKFPYLYQGFVDPTKNAYPESPTYPIISTGYGSVGLIDVATDFSAVGSPDNVPRWVPLFAETTGPAHALNLITGMMNHHSIPASSLMDDGKELILLNPQGTAVLIQMDKIQHEIFYNLSVKLALSYLGLDDHNIQRTPDALNLSDNAGHPIMRIPLVKGQVVEVNWFSDWVNPQLNPRTSALSVLKNGAYFEEGTPEQKAKAAEFFKNFKDAIVLIGPTDPILQDIAPTPFDADPVPKVGVYGNLLKMFFSGEYIRRVPHWVDPVLLFGLTALVGSLAVYNRRHAGWAKLAAVLVLAGYVFGVFEAFARLNLVLPLIVPASSAFTTAFAGAVLRLLDEEKQKKRIKGMFGTYLAPEVVNDIINSGEEPQLGGHNVSLTCFFSDVQSFSAFSEVLTPEKLVDLMNEYLTAMTDILQSERGSLDKYIGDAIVAMYGAPVKLKDDALRGCVAACRMHKRLGELRQKWISEGGKWPERVHKMRMRIGLNTGEAIVGNMGSSTRFNYTMMGDSVNLAARCESGAKQFGTYTMCTEDTMKSAGGAGSQVLFRRLNRIKVKGRSKPVEVYEVVCLRDEASADTLRCVELFEQALALYFAQKWDEAKALFAEAEKLEPLQPGRDPGVGHNPSELMQEACDKMKAHPPAPDWDGVLEMTEK